MPTIRRKKNILRITLFLASVILVAAVVYSPILPNVRAANVQVSIFTQAGTPTVFPKTADLTLGVDTIFWLCSASNTGNCVITVGAPFNINLNLAPGQSSVSFGPFLNPPIAPGLYPYTVTVGGVNADPTIQALSSTAGGISFPVNKVALLAPFISLASLIVAAATLTAVYVKRVKANGDRKRRMEESYAEVLARNEPDA